MALAFSKLFDAIQLTTTAATLYAMPASPAQVLKNGRVRFTNTTAGAITVTVHIVPGAGAAADANAFLKAYSIAANSYLDVDIPTMKASDSLQALASANTSITAHELGGVLYS